MQNSQFISFNRGFACSAVAGLLVCAVGVSQSNAGIAVEFDAASGVSDTSGAVDTWDATGVGAVTPTAAPYNSDASRRPTLVSSVFASGQPGIRFDAAPSLPDRDVMIFSDGGLPSGSADFTIVSVFQLLSLEVLPNTRPTWFSYGSQSGNFHLTGLAVDRPVGGNDLLLRENGTDLHTGLSLDTGENYVAIVTRSGSAITFDVMSQSGTSSTTGLDDGSNGGPISINLARGVLGNMVDPGHPDFQEAGFDGYLGLVQVYDTALNGSERTALLGQLSPYVVVPEPSTFALLGFAGLIGLLRRRR
jgi:hypothetical protein